MSIFSRISDFNKNTLIVGGGTFIGQLIPFLFLPFLTRLFGTTEFGIFSSYLTILAFLGIIANAKFDYAILLPKDDTKALKIFNLTLLIASYFGAALMFLGFILFFINLYYPIIPTNYNFLFILPLSVLVLGFFSPATFLSLRSKLFFSISISKILRALAISIISVILGYLSFNKFGLIAGDIVGQLLASTYLLSLLVKQGIIKFPIDFNLYHYKDVAFEYSNFPRYSLPSSFSENFAGVITMILMTAGLGMSVFGSFGFAQRIILSPSSIVSKSIGDVFRQSASALYAHQNQCKELYIATFKKLALISLVPFFVFFFFSPVIFSTIFGKDWAEAGRIGQLMAPMFILQFIANPLGNMFLIAGKQHLDFYIQITVAVVLSCLLYYGAYHLKSVDFCLLSYIIVYSFKYLLEIFLSYLFATNKWK